MARHRELAKELYASRIWRSVVFAGAMLGAPVTATADTPPPAKPNQAASRPAPPANPNAEKIAATQKKISDLEAKRGELISKVMNVETAAADLSKARTDLVTSNRQILAAVDELVKLRNPPRPRTPAVERPTGRGFVLS